MAKVGVLDQTGKQVAERELSSKLFEAPINVGLMHQAVVTGAAAIRSGTHSTKTRAEVSGGGKKPWRQKGTGRARHGSTRSPIWTGGGVTFGPKPRDHEKRLNKKMRGAALRSALSDALVSEKLAIIDDLSFDAPKTKDARALLQALELQGKILIVLPEPNDAVELSFRNLQEAHIAFSGGLAVWEVIAADRVLMTTTALDKLEERAG